MDDQQDFSAVMAERFASLPKVVQDAILSADVQAHMRELAKGHKLHIDQWQVLENNVMLTLLGFHPVSELKDRLKNDLSVTDEVALDLAGSISQFVFDPIRGEMERHLDHPSATEEIVSDVDAVRAQTLQTNTETVPQAPADPATSIPTTPVPAATPVAPATPPPPPVEGRAVRAQVSTSYAGSASHERKSIEGDPYREQI